MIEIEEIGVKFNIREKISVKDSLRFWSGWMQASGDTTIIDRWDLVVSLGLIENWECEYFKDYKTPLTEVEDVRIANVVMDVLARILSHMMELRAISKK